MLILRPPWDSQPQEVVNLIGPLPSYLDWAVQWGAQGLSGGLGFAPSGTISLAATTHGVGVAGNGSNGYTGRTVALSSAAPHLILCSFIYRESGTNTAAYAFGENAGVGAFLQIEVGSGGSVDARWRKANGGNITTFTGPTAVVGRRYDIALHICSDTPSDNQMFVNGVQYSGGGTGGGTAITYTRETVSALRRDTVSNYSKMPVLFTAYGKTNVPAAADTALWQTLLEWTRNGLSIFESRHLHIPLSITSGGAYTLNLETGVYSFSGTDATLTKDSRLTLDSGTYALSGSNASLLKGLILEASSGSYSLSGSDVSLFYTHLLNASSGSYAITGSDATLTYTPTAGAYTLNAESGAYVLLGQDVTFVYSGSEVTLKAGSWIRYRIIT